MKKTVIFFIAIAVLVLFMFTSCTPVYLEGIEEFDEGTSSFGLTAHLLPDKDFLSKFEYTDSMYHYYDNTINHINKQPLVERIIMVLEYEDDVYEQAKMYCMDNMVLSENRVYEYNGYSFSETLDIVNHDAESDFPQIFTMFSYNDEKHRLIFMGFACEITEVDNVNDLINQDFYSFLKEYFYEYYDFDK